FRLRPSSSFVPQAARAGARRRSGHARLVFRPRGPPPPPGRSREDPALQVDPGDLLDGVDVRGRAEVRLMPLAQLADLRVRVDHRLLEPRVDQLQLARADRERLERGAVEPALREVLDRAQDPPEARLLVALPHPAEAYVREV